MNNSYWKLTRTKLTHAAFTAALLGAMAAPSMIAQEARAARPSDGGGTAAAAPQPVHAQALYNSTSINASGPIYSVPAGKLLIIEMVTAAVTSPYTLGQTPSSLYLRTTVGGVQKLHAIALTQHPYSAQTNGYLATHMVKFYADGETTVDVSLNRPDAGGNMGVSMTISGYLVDALQ